MPQSSTALRSLFVSYHLEADAGFRVDELFAVVPPNCSLVTRVSLDRETCAHFAFRVVVSDGGSPPHSSSASVFVEVLDQNDSPPQFSTAVYNYTILENNEPNALVGTVLATDADVGENAALSFALEGPTRHLFWIDAMGRLFARSSLNREQRAVHQLAVVASDHPLGGSPLKSTARIQVFIGSVSYAISMLSFSTILNSYILREMSVPQKVFSFSQRCERRNAPIY